MGPGGGLGWGEAITFLQGLREEKALGAGRQSSASPGEPEGSSVGKPETPSRVWQGSAGVSTSLYNMSLFLRFRQAAPGSPKG